LTATAGNGNQPRVMVAPPRPPEAASEPAERSLGPSSGNTLRLPTLIGVLGVVYGDIGTSPLYALRASLVESGQGAGREDVLGVVSLILWALILMVSLKYVTLVLRADNRGEGGILALMALAQRGSREIRTKRLTMIMGIVGAALFFGDGAITPAISVLSAVEGLQIVEPRLAPYIIPISLVVLIGLFAVQQLGTERVGAWFGPICAAWFVTIGVLGLGAIFDRPDILFAFDPRHGIGLLWNQGFRAYSVLGSTVLAITGAEALYADMGHFGRRPIRATWLAFVQPALMLNYLGQGALLLGNPAALENPFYLLAPSWFRLPLVVLATAATVIASQSMISGAFSLARQATQMGLLPRLTVRHTSREGEGQIYMPQINGLLLIAVLFLVVEFRNSDRLAHAYGIAVTGTFAMTSCLGVVVARRIWGWPRFLAVGVFGFFLAIDATFFMANVPKIPTGGWFPLILGIALFLMMTTWKRGRDLLAERWRQDSLPLSTFVARPPRSALRVPGTAVFMTGNSDLVPGALLHNLKHNKVLHERILFVTVVSDEAPTIANRDRTSIEEMAPGIYRVRIRYGFIESPNVPRALARLERQGLTLDPMQTSYFLGREQLVPAFATRMPRWRHTLFVAMARNAVSATEFFRIPSDRVVELGVRVAI